MSIACVSVSIAFMFAWGAVIFPLRANEMPALFGSLPSMELPAGYVDFSSGMNGTAQGWTAFSSATIGLAAPLDQDGWRLKFSGYYSQYKYSTRENFICEKNESAEVQSNVTIRKICEEILNSGPEALSEETKDFLNRNGYTAVKQNLARITQHQADRYQFSIAPGYRVTLSGLILKAHLGLAYQNEIVTPEDDTRSRADTIWGAEGLIEAWLDLSEKNWVSADGSYFTGTQNYSAELKFGHRPVSWLSLGPELAGFGDSDYVSGRAGAFVRFDTGQIETTLSGGVAGTYEDDPRLYGAANFYFRF